MSILKTLYKQTFIHGLATVVPKMLSFLLVRLHTDKTVLENVADYGDVSLIYAYFVLFNVLLAYGMETAFFRFFSSDEHKKTVLSTSTISLILTSILVLVLGYFFFFFPRFLDFSRREINHFSRFSTRNSKPEKCASLGLTQWKI